MKFNTIPGNLSTLPTDDGHPPKPSLDAKAASNSV